MIKTSEGLKAFCTTQYRYHRVVLKCKKIDNDIIEIIHIHNLGNEGNGKIVLGNLFQYARELRYKLIKLEVYHNTDYNGLSHINTELVNYYQKLGFITGDIFSNNVYMEREITGDD
jgi:GNAT superfamily N-acetyltransferase